MDKDFPLKEFAIVGCAFSTIGIFSVYYLLLRPDAMIPDQKMKVVLANLPTGPSIENPSAESGTAINPTDIVVAFSKSLQNSQAEIMNSKMNQLIDSAPSSAAVQIALKKILRDAHNAHSVNLEAELNSFESNRNDSIRTVVFLLDHFKNDTEQSDRLVSSLNQMPLSEATRMEMGRALLNWSKDSVAEHAGQIQIRHQWLKSFSEALAHEYILEMKKIPQNSDIQDYLFHQFPNEQGN